jgi:hypothetical protein
MPASDGASFRKAQSNRPVDGFNISRRTEGQGERLTLSAIQSAVFSLAAVPASSVPLLPNSLCPRQEKRTMRTLKV